MEAAARRSASTDLTGCAACSSVTTSLAVRNNNEVLLLWCGFQLMHTEI